MYGSDVNAYDETWARTIMKPRLDRATGKVDGYVFDHSGDKIRATEHLLIAILGESSTANEAQPPASG